MLNSEENIGDVLYELLDNEENGITIIQEMSDNETDVEAWNCIIDAVAYTSRLVIFFWIMANLFGRVIRHLSLGYSATGRFYL